MLHRRILATTYLEISQNSPLEIETSYIFFYYSSSDLSFLLMLTNWNDQCHLVSSFVKRFSTPFSRK